MNGTAEGAGQRPEPHAVLSPTRRTWGAEGYDVPFGLERYDRMAAVLKSMKGRAVVSVNDIPQMRQAFAALKRRLLSITCTVGSAEHRAASRELLMSNF